MADDDAIEILKAIMLGGDYPPDGVEDTPENRKLWDDTTQAIANMPPGTIVDIPFD